MHTIEENFGKEVFKIIIFFSGEVVLYRNSFYKNNNWKNNFIIKRLNNKLMLFIFCVIFVRFYKIDQF